MSAASPLTSEVWQFWKTGWVGCMQCLLGMGQRAGLADLYPISAKEQVAPMCATYAQVCWTTDDPCGLFA
eukprot:5627821-Heterocapsa_arctica.AAC.1